MKSIILVDAQTAESVKALATELKAIDFSVTLDLDKEIELKKLDSSQLKMAFFNLCKNGVEALVEHKVPSPRIRLVPRQHRMGVLFW